VKDLEDNTHAVDAQSIMSGIGWPVSDSAEVVRAIGALVSAQLAVALETRLATEEAHLGNKVALLAWRGLGYVELERGVYDKIRGEVLEAFDADKPIADGSGR
jgi:hypothetical protein